ncbi:MAG: glycosyltransferase [Alphaproteobacteria bacterium]|nr:glycosyltransferase [Alphaproteobacteria bacterium]
MLQIRHEPTPAALIGGPLVSIVVPTLNERANVNMVIEALRHAMGTLPWEVIFVDDNSKDGTAEEAKQIARSDNHVRCIRRIGRRGLASAGAEGFLASSAPYVALMDGDLQHDETLLPQMFQMLESGDDVVIASRYIAGGSSSGLASTERATLSLWGGLLANRLLKIRCSDAMSGFFMMRREVFDKLAPRLSTIGFKLLADILASADQPLAIAELPLRFRARLAGDSKLDTGVKVDFLLLLLDKTVGRVAPVRFVLFSLIGASGLAVHMAALAFLHLIAGIGFELAQALAASVAMTSNFLINNAVTYRDRRLNGARLLTGLLTFYAICAVGFIANVGIANAVFTSGTNWLLAGVAGACVGAVWNFAMSSQLTWKAST